MPDPMGSRRAGYIYMQKIYQTQTQTPPILRPNVFLITAIAPHVLHDFLALLHRHAALFGKDLREGAADLAGHV